MEADILTLDSVAAVPPDLGPQLPIYPQVNLFARVAGNAQPGNLYAGFVVQAVLTSGPPAFRDREACWIWEPNGIALTPGYYDTRLIGSYQGLPLLTVTCCP